MDLRMPVLLQSGSCILGMRQQVSCAGLVESANVKLAKAGVFNRLVKATR